MSVAWSWLETIAADAPARLRDRMRSAVAASSGESVHAHLANAATVCLRAALEHPSSKAAALDLLSADALLTHACAAAAEAGGDELTQFMTKLSPQHFQDILDAR